MKDKLPHADEFLHWAAQPKPVLHARFGLKSFIAGFSMLIFLFLSVFFIFKYFSVNLSELPFYIYVFFILIMPFPVFLMIRPLRYIRQARRIYYAVANKRYIILYGHKNIQRYHEYPLQITDTAIGSYRNGYGYIIFNPLSDNISINPFRNNIFSDIKNGFYGIDSPGTVQDDARNLKILYSEKK